MSVAKLPAPVLAADDQVMLSGLASVEHGLNLAVEVVMTSVFAAAVVGQGMLVAVKEYSEGEPSAAGWSNFAAGLWVFCWFVVLGQL